MSQEYAQGCTCSGSCRSVEEAAESGEKRKIAQFALGLAFIGASFFTPSEQFRAAMLLCAYAVLGYEVLLTMVKNALKGSFFDENFLMGIATVGAIALGEYPEAVGVMLFYGIGEFFQERAFNGSRASIKALIGVKPEYANLVTETGIKVVRPEDVPVNSVIAVKPGERIPLDGIVTEGDTSLDMSALTGESVPVTVLTGGEVLSGSINISSLIKVKTTKTYSSSTVARILDAAFEASSKKAPAEKFITKFSRYYTPAVVACAVVISFIVPLALGQPVSGWLHRGLIFLVVSCPCALVLSVPLGYFAGMGACSKKGVLVKGGGSLDALASLKTVVFDKTGTLTKGVFNVSEVRAAQGFTEQEIVEIAAGIESFSNHPIGKSIVAYYGGEPDVSPVSGFEEIGGSGVRADYNNRPCFLGSAAFIREQGHTFEEYDGAGSVVYISAGGEYAGYIAVSDEIKDDSAQAISALREMGVESVMLTGDKLGAAERIAKLLGIGRFYAELLPEEKLKTLEEIMAENPKHKTAFAGDGINDAPSLSRADISVAMGALGQDAAIEASDVVIMNDSPSRIVDTVIIAKKVRLLVLENIVFALGVKALFLTLGALGMANMWMATFADVGVALLAILNSMRGRK